MQNMNSSAAHHAKAAMLIRKPVNEVYEAFINPAITTLFWFTHSNGRLDVNKNVEWTWEMYNDTASVTVKEIIQDQKIIIEWGKEYNITTVEWSFKSLPQGTFVEIINNGFSGNDDALTAQVRDSTEGFTLVLAGLKALLEHNVQLNLVGDRFPPGLA